MALPSGSLVRVANQPAGGFAVLSNSPSTQGTLGSNTNGVTIETAGTYGTRVISLTATSSDSAVVNVFVYILRSSTVIPLGLVAVPANSGNLNASRFNVDFLNGSNILGLPIDNTGRQYIPLLAGDVLRASTLATLSVGASCFIHASALDYLAP